MSTLLRRFLIACFLGSDERPNIHNVLIPVEHNCNFVTYLTILPM